MPVDVTISQDVAAGSAETIELPRSGTSTASGSALASPGARVRPAAIVAGSGLELAGETLSLRRARLRAAAVFITVMLCVLTLRNAITGWQLWPVVAVLTAVIAGMAAILSAPRVKLERWLWVIEISVFGLVAVILAVMQYSSIITAARNHDPVALFGNVKNTIIGTLLLSFTYCMLIPNTWRAAARTVLILWTVAFCTEVAAVMLNPEVPQLARQIINSSRISENLLIGFVGTSLAVYGAHVVNSLRREAFEAKQVNQYHLGRKLGGGGMGEVFLAEHQMLKRPCAIKLIRPEAADDPHAMARFEREVQATARLSHQNTIEIYDYGRTQDGVFYYVMEYLRGASFDALVTRRGPLPPGRVIYLLRQACEALAEAHNVGLIHRDIKPANLFAAIRGGRCDVVKLLDFGLVKARDDGTTAAQTTDARLRGTPLYIAPEQVTGEATLDHRADLYSLGCVAFFLLTGRPPFEHENAMRVMLAHARDPAPTPSQVNVDVPADLEAVVLRCLAKSPEERYPDAIALGRALDACAASKDWNADQAARWWTVAEREAFSN